MDYAKESLKMHYELRGKLEMTSRAAVDTKDALSLAYTPGVAAPCLEIQKDVNKSYELTRRWNTVAVVTDGTAVLGLGDIGPEAGMPVMEGKCVLFKEFGGVDAIPLCVRSKDVDDIVNTVRREAGRDKHPLRSLRSLLFCILYFLCFIALVSCHYSRPNLEDEHLSKETRDSLTYLFERHYTWNTNLEVLADSVNLACLPVKDCYNMLYRGDRVVVAEFAIHPADSVDRDRKSTRLNSSH